VYVESSRFPRIDIDEDEGSLVMRTLFFGTRLPLLSSWVGMGEFFSVAGKKMTQAAIGTDGYL
jgi:hypothetical protein